MAQMNISLPDGLKNWAETRVAEGDYSSTSDYVRDLMRRDRERGEALEQLRIELQKGLDSPRSDATLESIIARAKANGVV